MKTKNTTEELSRPDYLELQRQLEEVVAGLHTAAISAGRIAETLNAAKTGSTVGEQWARTWGETLPKTAAAEMLNVSVNHLSKIISEGGIRTTPDGRVLVRSAAEWANRPATAKRTAYRV